MARREDDRREAWRTLATRLAASLLKGAAIAGDRLMPVGGEERVKIEVVVSVSCCTNGIRLNIDDVQDRSCTSVIWPNKVELRDLAAAESFWTSIDELTISGKHMTTTST